MIKKYLRLFLYHKTNKQIKIIVDDVTVQNNGNIIYII